MTPGRKPCLSHHCTLRYDAAVPRPYLFYPRKFPKLSSSSQPGEIEHTHATSQLPEGGYNPVPSVTERTTDLLAHRKIRDASGQG